MYRLKIVLLATAALACLNLSCGNKSGNDQALTNDIQSKLNADATTKPANINVAVKDGVVTLSGDVPNSDVELQAMKVANGTAGVRSVNDQMKVNPAMAGNQLPNAGNNTQPQQAPANQLAATQPPPKPTATPATAAPSREESSPEPSKAAPEPAPAPKPVSVTIPAGSELSVRMIDSIDSGRNKTGDTFRATLNAPLESRGKVVIPAGAPVTVTLTNAKGAGRIKGNSELEVQATSIEYQGRSHAIQTSAFAEQGKGRGKQTAVRTGIGAAAGAVIGAIAGGGKGAAIGSLAGGGAGAGFQLATHGQQVKIPSEAVISFQLQAPLTLRERRGE